MPPYAHCDQGFGLRGPLGRPVWFGCLGSCFECLLYGVESPSLEYGSRMAGLHQAKTVGWPFGYHTLG